MCKLILMAGFRAFYNFQENDSIGSFVSLSPDESRHLCGSLRASNGDNLKIFDLSGNFADATIQEPSQKKCILKITSPKQKIKNNYSLTLAQCLPKGKTFDDLIPTCVQIGVSRIIPIISSRSQVKISTEDSQKKLIKWNNYLIEAIKQSSNFFPLQIDYPTSLQKFFENSHQFSKKFVASLEPNSTPLLLSIQQNLNHQDSPCILIGPEGDLSPQEYSQSKNYNFLPVSLGKNIMKSDTAAIYSISILQAFFESKIS